jgi:hypothetical protein
LWDHAPVGGIRRIAENSIAIPGPALDRLSDTAHEAKATLVLGLSERVAKGAGD